jgi:periplasmic protein TonB
MKKHLLICLLLCISLVAFSQDTKDTIPEFNPDDIAIDADFPGGIPAWSAFVSKAMNKKEKQLRKSGEQGTVVILFIIDKNGNVTNIKALSCADAGVPRCLPPGSKLAEIAIDIISESPPWKPATLNGKPVKAYRRQPISFILQ